MAVTDIDAEQVSAALQNKSFDIGGNPYGVMTSISAYVSSIYSAMQSLEQSWASAYTDVGEYIKGFKGVPSPEGNPLSGADFLNGEDGISGSLQNVNTFLNVRSGSGINNQAIGALSAGMAFTVLGEGETDSDGTMWYRVKYKDENGKDVEGYASSKYIKLDETAESAAASESGQGSESASGASENSGGASGSSGSGAGSGGSNSDSSKNKNTGAARALADSDLNLQDENGKSLGTLEQGSEITIVKDDGKSPLVAIKLSDGTIAYVERSKLNFISNNSKVARVKLRNLNNRLNVRSTPSSTDNTNIVTTLGNNSSVEIVGDSGVLGWTKIKLNGKERYVSSEYIDI